MNTNIETAIDPAITARMAAPTDHRLSSDDGELSTVFSWQVDRYAHVIHAPEDQRLTSIEGTPADDWPASAAISQLSTEIIDGRPTILGVGCSGTTHFSVSVQIEEAADGNPVIVFDWAARLAKPLSPTEIATKSIHDNKNEQPLAWLGSSYRISASGHDKWNIKSIEGTRLDHEIDEHEQRLSIQPARMNEVRTVVWSYRVKIM